jgi:hypothetical protein
MMVALVVSSIVALGIFAFASIQQATSGLHTRSIRVQQSLDGAMWSMSQDIRAAGLGFARLCSELRIWDGMNYRLINPGGYAAVQQAVQDANTGEPYWVLRDGIQAHWNSSQAGSDFAVCQALGPDFPNCPADTFDVIMGERNYVGSFGAFILVDDEGTKQVLEVKTESAIIDPGNPQHEAQVRQLFPPGSFLLIVPRPSSGSGGNDFFDPEGGQKQCPVLQLTDDVKADASNDRWDFKVDGNQSSFNRDKEKLLYPESGDPEHVVGEFEGAADLGNAWVVPLGRLRWSRYAVDYTAATVPYLVRYDFIGFDPGVDPDNLGDIDYPSCAAQTCRGAGLHLPDHNNPPIPVAIGPMIEDMQVAVGCDGRAAMPADPPGGVAPEAGFDDKGPNTGPLANMPNLLVDEYDTTGAEDRQRDEWLGNARDEVWAPDCVFHGTAGAAAPTRVDWVIRDGNSPPPNFRMSPHTIRITLIGAAEELSAPGGLASDMLMPIEDRPEMPALSGRHERYTLTERFTPRNLRWRNPAIF